MLLMEGHRGLVSNVIFGGTGQPLVTAGVDGKIVVWDPPHLLAESKPFAGLIRTLALDLAGHSLAIGIDGRPGELWDYPRLQPSRRLPESDLAITGLGFVQKDELLVIGVGDPQGPVQSAQCIFLWNRLTGKRQSIPLDRAATNAGVRALAVLPDYRLVAWATDNGALVVWDMTRPDAHRFSLKSYARSIAFSPDGRLLAAATDWKILVFDLHDRCEKMAITGHRGVVSSVAFNPDGRTLMSGSWDKTVRWWDVGNGREERSFDWPIGRVSTTCFARDGLRAAAAGDEGKILIWDTDG